MQTRYTPIRNAVIGDVNRPIERFPNRNAAQCPPDTGAIVVRTVVLRDALSAPALGAYPWDPDFHDSPVTTRDSPTNPEYDFLPVHGVRVR